MEPFDQRLRAAILQVVEKQLQDNDPPATREAFVRLRGEGFPENEAKKLIGYVVASEVFGVLREGRRYDEQAFAAKLKALPRLPWEEE
ncbi:MAG: hypothetical protein M0017_12540 [Desulfobacteraceae bacterium]|nr:hypothetical protein [Desulfobacteraceae bacterium]